MDFIYDSAGHNTIWQGKFTKHTPRSENVAVSPLTKITLENGVTFDF